MSAVPELRAVGLGFDRDRRRVLDAADLGFGAGELVSLLGANGAGKTTLLRLMLGLDRPARGLVRLDGRPLAELSRRAIARRVAYVPQSHFAPFPYRVREVVGLGRLAVRGLFRPPGRHDAEVVASTLDRLGLTALAERPYTALSGGERQQVLIARALAQDAGLMIMDEPLSGLDYGNQHRLLDRLGDLAAAGLGILLTTHAPDLAAAVSTRVAVLAGGRIIDDGPPDRVVTQEMIARIYGVIRSRRRDGAAPAGGAASLRP